MKHAFLYFLVIAFFLGSCKNIKEPEFRGIESVKLDGFSLKKTAAVVYLKYYNPNKFQAKLKSAEGDAWINNIALGHFIVDTTIAVKGKSDFLVPVKVDLDMKQILAFTLTSMNEQEVDIRIAGKAKAARSGFSKSFPINWQGKQNIGNILQHIQ